jgi:hypothetical protein
MIPAHIPSAARIPSFSAHGNPIDRLAQSFYEFLLRMQAPFFEWFAQRPGLREHFVHQF